MESTEFGRYTDRKMYCGTGLCKASSRWRQGIFRNAKVPIDRLESQEKIWLTRRREVPVLESRSATLVLLCVFTVSLLIRYEGLIFLHHACFVLIVHDTCILAGWPLEYACRVPVSCAVTVSCLLCVSVSNQGLSNSQWKTCWPNCLVLPLRC